MRPMCSLWAAGLPEARPDCRPLRGHDACLGAKLLLRWIGMGHRRFSDQIRVAVDASEQSRYAICKAIGLNQGAMSRFMAGKGGLSMEVVDRLAEFLGLRVVVRKPGRQE